MRILEIFVEERGFAQGLKSKWDLAGRSGKREAQSINCLFAT